MFWIPMAIGAAAGALTNKDPLKGAVMGAGGGGLLAGGAQGLTAAPGAGMALTSATQPAAASGLGGLLSKGNMQTVGDVAGLAQKAGVFNDPAAPQAQSAGIPGRGGVDFSGLLSAGRANNVSGAQLLAQQRAARRGA